VFNILADRVCGRRVLDLFAGTGALGIESLSRGADKCVFIDQSHQVVALIKKNLSACRLLDQTEVIRWEIKHNLNCLRSRTALFDLVFMDPPYRSDLLLPALSNLRDCRCLSADALIIAEHAESEPLPPQLSGFRLIDQRRYGKTLVSFLDFVL
jgi:16S rRNA (guanine966-N2)-methyltransferase